MNRKKHRQLGKADANSNGGGLLNDLQDWLFDDYSAICNHIMVHKQMASTIFKICKKLWATFDFTKFFQNT